MDRKFIDPVGVFQVLRNRTKSHYEPSQATQKLERLQLKAEECTTREEAQKIIKKADKVHRKLTEG